jgi:hypothetical protein
MTDHTHYELWSKNTIDARAECLAHVAETSDGWYWYGDGVNTLCTTGSVATLAEAKAQAVAHFRNGW